MDCLLSSYVSEGKAEVLPWPIRPKAEFEIHSGGLLLVLNECVYRVRYNVYTFFLKAYY